MSKDRQGELEALGRRLEAKGFWFRPRAYFAPCGILVATPPVSRPIPATTTGEDLPEYIQVLEATVCLYHSGASWEARVTTHGGPQWVRRAATLDALEELALEALGSREVPPGPEWCSV